MVKEGDKKLRTWLQGFKFQQRHQHRLSFLLSFSSSINSFLFVTAEDKSITNTLLVDTLSTQSS